MSTKNTTLFRYFDGGDNGVMGNNEKLINFFDDSNEKFSTENYVSLTSLA